MNEKYEYLFLTYMYNLLGLKNYEKKLEDSGIKQMEYTENGDLFKYFSLLNKGDSSFLSDDEKNELELLSMNELSSYFDNAELKAKCEDFLKRTYKKYFFSNLPSDGYIYYGPISYDFMAPRDAIALGINYVKFVDAVEGEEYENTLSKQEHVVYGVINEIQEDIAPSFGLKVAVIEQNELALSRHSVTF